MCGGGRESSRTETERGAWEIRTWGALQRRKLDAEELRNRPSDLLLSRRAIVGGLGGSAREKGGFGKKSASRQAEDVLALLGIEKRNTFLQGRDPETGDVARGRSEEKRNEVQFFEGGKEASRHAAIKLGAYCLW